MPQVGAAERVMPITRRMERQADETLFRDSAGQLIAITAEGSITYNASDSSD